MTLVNKMPKKTNKKTKTKKGKLMGDPFVELG